jgi:hypothetical protein
MSHFARVKIGTVNIVIVTNEQNQTWELNKN